MVSTATQISHFSFDNCLMNAAGVYCMTKEELMEVESLKPLPLSPKQGRLKFVQVIQNLATQILVLVLSIQWDSLIMVFATT